MGYDSLFKIFYFDIQVILDPASGHLSRPVCIFFIRVSTYTWPLLALCSVMSSWSFFSSLKPWYLPVFQGPLFLSIGKKYLGTQIQVLAVCIPHGSTYNEDVKKAKSDIHMANQKAARDLWGPWLKISVQPLSGCVSLLQWLCLHYLILVLTHTNKCYKVLALVHSWGQWGW